jgi:hypothetical protein
MSTQIYQTHIAPVVAPFAPSTPDGDLARQFFVYFARFEYAMKRSKYLKGDETRAEADWDKLGNCLHKKFDPARMPELQAAVDYLMRNPPQKQVVVNGVLDWRPVVQGSSERYSRFMLRLVCTVRNNLFHGGKFPSPTGPIAESSRDRNLLENCLIVLAECSQCETTLQQYLPLDV